MNLLWHHFATAAADYAGRQIPDYVASIGVTYDLPFALEGRQLISGYTVPAEQRGNVEQAMVNCGLLLIRTIDTGNGAVTYLFELPSIH